MRTQSLRKGRLLVALALVFSLGLVGTVTADESSSSNYKVTETQIGGVGSSEDDCSGNYCAKITAGDLVVGTGKSSNYSAQFGANTTADPLLEVITQAGTTDMGVLDTNVTGTATAYVKVRNYLSGGYIIQITGNPPSQGIHTLTALTTPSTSHQGAEQFGINMVDNTSPNIGANPVQVPNNGFSFGEAATDYDTPDLFKYVNGDIVAQSLSSSGQTDYTLSMIINVSGATPGGRYTGNLSAVVVPIY